MNTQDLTKSLPPTPGVQVPSSSTLKPTTHHERVAEVPNVSQPPGIARGDRARPRDPETEDLGWSEDPTWVLFSGCKLSADDVFCSECLSL